MADRLVFKKVSSPEPAADYVAGLINEHLRKNHSVLWLVPGGSAMEVAVETAERVRGGINPGALVISLTDERYGPPGHRDSNWQQLMASGFDLPGASLHPVLEGKDLAQTARDYADMLSRQMEKCDFRLALAGMGPDGHIFGILPGSPAVNSGNGVIGYEWQDFTRLTPTPKTLKRLDEVMIYAVGEPKWPQIAKLKDDIAAADQPAQLLKKLERVTFFNDYQGEEL